MGRQPLAAGGRSGVVLDGELVGVERVAGPPILVLDDVERFGPATHPRRDDLQDAPASPPAMPARRDRIAHRESFAHGGLLLVPAPASSRAPSLRPPQCPATPDGRPRYCTLFARLVYPPAGIFVASRLSAGRRLPRGTVAWRGCATLPQADADVRGCPRRGSAESDGGSRWTMPCARCKRRSTTRSRSLGRWASQCSATTSAA